MKCERSMEVKCKLDLQEVIKNGYFSGWILVSQGSPDQTTLYPFLIHANNPPSNLDSGLPWWCSGKEFGCQCRGHNRLRSDPCVRKMPGVGNGNPLQYYHLENSLAEEPDWLQFMGSQSRTGLSD